MTHETKSNWDGDKVKEQGKRPHGAHAIGENTGEVSARPFDQAAYAAQKIKDDERVARLRGTLTKPAQ